MLHVCMRACLREIYRQYTLKSKWAIIILRGLSLALIPMYLPAYCLCQAVPCSLLHCPILSLSGTAVMLGAACAVYRRRRRKRVSSGNNGVDIAVEEMTSRDDLLDPAHDHSHDPAIEEGHNQPADVLELHAVKPVNQKTWTRNGE